QGSRETAGRSRARVEQGGAAGSGSAAAGEPGGDMVHSVRSGARRIEPRACRGLQRAPGNGDVGGAAEPGAGQRRGVRAETGLTRSAAAASGSDYIERRDGRST